LAGGFAVVVILFCLFEGECCKLIRGSDSHIDQKRERAPIIIIIMCSMSLVQLSLVPYNVLY